MKDLVKVPQHVAIIMDGNGRWAGKRRLPRIAGHRAGAKAVREAVEAARSLGVKVLTLYTFSTENWKRPKKEIDALFGMLEQYLEKERNKLVKNDIKLSVIGRIEDLPEGVRQKLRSVMDATKNNKSLTLNLALNYGGRAEILDAVRRMAQDSKDGRLEPSSIDEALFSRYLYTRELPDPDMLIRTSGEMRISNFLLWQISYTELYVTKTLWPDFKRKDFEKAVKEYQKRTRRFGG